ncbi:hypothetical protein L2X99_14630 [Microbacterium sp. KUDC0406]|uniref:hypothetical protein n=1 Tax=Microbacterium sp. KUDC0406 TaxID=2909588 RepID=UPI001F1FBE59|nr:hypothetical protein [Microbacterium sp. KUDC0406]UJP09634.1 hypothetical protein L2X99_14630 [Microbacterium sp. KUDC0406]
MPIGIGGAVLAVLCALVAGIALALGAAGLFGGAAGVWIVGTVLSIASSFAGAWMPVMISLAALAVACVLGGITRAVVASIPSRAPAAELVAEQGPAAAQKQKKVGVQTAAVRAVAS